MKQLIVVINTKNLAMYDLPLELDCTNDSFGLIGGISTETISVSVFAMIMNIDRFYYYYGKLDRFKKQFPDWEQFMSEHDIAFFGKEGRGGFLIVKS